MVIPFPAVLVAQSTFPLFESANTTFPSPCTVNLAAHDGVARSEAGEELIVEGCEWFEVEKRVSPMLP